MEHTLKCPVCRTRFTSVFSDLDPPRVGDYSVCGYCLTIMVYAEITSRIHVRVATTTEHMQFFLANGPQILEQVTAATDYIFACPTTDQVCHGHA